VGAALLAAGSLAAQTAADRRSATEIRLLFEQFNAAWERRDSAFISRFYAHDSAGVFFFERRQLRGWPQVDTLYRHMFASAARGQVRSHFDILDVGARGELGWLAANFRLEVIGAGGDTTVDEGRQSVVLERRGGQWVVVHRHTSFQAPPGPQRRVPLHTTPEPLWSPPGDSSGRSDVRVIPALPTATTNNAVASGRIGRDWWAFSALGLDSTLRWSGITRNAYAWWAGTASWRELPPVPGPAGRLAATAQVVRGRLYLFGGYTVDSAGGERSLPNVDIYEPESGVWRAGAPTPVAVDDAVSGVYQDSLVYLVSGWHDTDNVRNVQVYDVARDSWFQATPTPGPGVFGHSGTLAGGTIVYVDGALRQESGPRYRLVSQTWVGTIAAGDPLSIAWVQGPAHPEGPLYRAASGSCGPLIVIAGGTTNPYNFDGIGYDGRPSAPSRLVSVFDTRTRVWSRLADLPAPAMDLRGLVRLDRAGWILGGMRSDRRVVAEAVPVVMPSCAGEAPAVLGR
jgi:ketosteroid isomerase-like protein/N-acetylneuraminic acid mutarotase